MIVAGSALLTALASLPSVTPGSAGGVLIVCGLGLLLGVRHSTDADHVVALSTIVSKQRSVRRAALIGLLWGVGHTITIVAVGSLIILFNVRIPARLGLSMEFSVAVMLVILGMLNLTGVLQRVTNYFALQRTAAPVRPPGARDDRQTSRIEPFLQLGLFHSIRPLFIGLVHGLAGSAAVALLVLATIHNPVWATAYLLIFGLGTVMGMMLMTTLVAVPLKYGTKRFARLNERLATASGVVSVCFGILLMYQLGFVGGLFTRHPHWTPQ